MTDAPTTGSDPNLRPELLDKVEIQEVLSRYANAVDARDWDALERVFVPGSVVDFTNNGGIRDTYPAIVDYLRESLSIFAAVQHYMTNVVIDVDGDRATARNYVFTQMITLGDGDESILSDGGFYDSTFVRTPDGWRLESYVASLVWLDGQWPDGVPRPAWWGVSSDRFGAPSA